MPSIPSRATPTLLPFSSACVILAAVAGMYPNFLINVPTTGIFRTTQKEHSPR